MNKPVDCKHGVDDGACKECYLEATNLQAKIDNLYENNARLDAEIEALKKEAALQRLSDFTQEAECKQAALTQTEIMTALTLGTPLYTHPADLTDAEIIEIWTEFDNKDADDYFIAIAREILRKAKEK